MAAYSAYGLAVAACLLSSIVFYLGAPNQQWFASRVLGFYPALLISIVLAAVSWWLFHLNLSGLSATFTVFYLLMLCLCLLPFISPHKTPLSSGKKEKKKINKEKNGSPYQTQWRLKIAIGLLLGFPLSVATAGLISWWGPGDISNDNKTQLVMWLVTPLWLTSLSLIFFVSTAKRLLAGYCGFSLFIYSLLWIARSGS